MENSIIDLIIRLKNGYMAKREEISSPYSKFKEQILKKLKEIGFISNFRTEGEEKKNMVVALKYNQGEPAITDVKILSKPGQRFYVSYRDLKIVLSGFGYSILSTPLGILTNKEARKKKVGGEILFNIW